LSLGIAGRYIHYPDDDDRASLGVEGWWAPSGTLAHRLEPQAGLVVAGFVGGGETGTGTSLRGIALRPAVGATLYLSPAASLSMSGDVSLHLAGNCHASRCRQALPALLFAVILR
jgi:hypothetical protein